MYGVSSKPNSVRQGDQELDFMFYKSDRALVIGIEAVTTSIDKVNVQLSF